MEILINAWGGEGFLSASTITLLACVGMFKDLAPTDGKIHLRVLDFATDSNDDRQRKLLQKAYENYYTVVFGREKEIVFDSVSMEDIANFRLSNSLTGKFGENRSLFGIGCSEMDMNLNITKGIYGKPWLGEIYHSDAKFEKLYEDAPPGEAVIINCGGYRGGGTAATFIPLEAIHPIKHLSPKRFAVISGPSTAFKHEFALPYPDLYASDPEIMKRIRKINIFDAAEILDLLNRNFKDFSEDAYEKHLKNIRRLEKYRDEIYSEDHDYRNLNPQFYTSRFLDRIFSDTSNTAAVFMNIKTDGRELLPFDVVSEQFEPDTQCHKLHISSLLNAISVMEIARNHKNYDGGKVYSFGCSAGDRYTPRVLFKNECFRMYWDFIIMSVIIVRHVYNAFRMPFRKEYSAISEKWFMVRQSGLFKKTDIPENKSFAEIMCGFLADFINNYIIVVMKSFSEIDSTSEQCVMFCEEVRNFSENLKNFAQPDNSENITDGVSMLITGIVKHISGVSSLSDGAKVKEGIDGFLKIYNENFPKFESDDRNEMTIKFYSEKIIRYTLQKCSEIIF